MTWARRLKRVFNIDIDTCPRCQGPMKIIACIEDPDLIGKILTHRHEQATATQASRHARAPPAEVRGKTSLCREYMLRGKTPAGPSRASVTTRTPPIAYGPPRRIAYGDGACRRQAADAGQAPERSGVGELERAIRRMTKDEGTTIVLVEQHADVALGLTEKAIVLERGRIAHRARSRELLADTALLLAESTQ